MMSVIINRFWARAAFFSLAVRSPYAVHEIWSDRLNGLSHDPRNGNSGIISSACFFHSELQAHIVLPLQAYRCLYPLELETECNIRSRSPCLVFFYTFWLSTSYL